MNTFKFKYKGYTFVPVGQIDPKISLKKASEYLASDFELGMLNYGIHNKKGWNYKGFYKTVPQEYKTCDVFYCEQTRKNYIPCDNELMIWNGGFKKLNFKNNY